MQHHRYSPPLVIAYAMFLTLVHGERRQISRILLTFCILILVGCLLENHAGLRHMSDAVRGEGPVEVTAHDGLMAVAIGVAAETSAREKRAVEMSELGF